MIILYFTTSISFCSSSLTKHRSPKINWRTYKKPVLTPWWHLRVGCCYTNCCLMNSQTQWLSRTLRYTIVLPKGEMANSNWKFPFKTHKHDDTSQLLTITSYVLLQDIWALLAQIIFYLPNRCRKTDFTKATPSEGAQHEKKVASWSLVASPKALEESLSLYCKYWLLLRKICDPDLRARVSFLFCLLWLNTP